MFSKTEVGPWAETRLQGMYDTEPPFFCAYDLLTRIIASSDR